MKKKPLPPAKSASATGTRSRAATKAETREALITAAHDLFAEEGLDAPSLDAICARAGFTRGAFYVHFAERDDLLVAVMDRVIGGIVDAAVGDGEDLGAMAARFARLVAEGDFPVVRTHGIRPHQILQACARSPRVRAAYVDVTERAIARVGRAITQAQRAGTVRGDVDPTVVAATLVALVNGMQALSDASFTLDAAKVGATLLQILGAAPR